MVDNLVCQRSFPGLEGIDLIRDEVFEFGDLIQSLQTCRFDADRRQEVDEQIL